MSRHANYTAEIKADCLVLYDAGPWDVCLTITNDVEFVVKELTRTGMLKPDQHLFYYDSEGQYAKIIHRDGKFLMFAPAIGDLEE